MEQRVPSESEGPCFFIVYWAAMYSAHYSILQCPVTKEDLQEADKVVIAFVNTKLSTAEKFTQGLINRSATIFYPVKQNILFLHQHYCIPLTEDKILNTITSFEKE